MAPFRGCSRRRGDRMKRREFMALLGGAVAWPLAARAEQAERMRRIGVLLPFSADDAESQVRMGAFLQTLALSGWTIGRNLRIDIRWAGINADDIRKHAAALTALTPDVILAHGASTVRPLQQATRSVPIVFPVVGDPVGAGIVGSLARPGGNITGFMISEYSMGGKWLELLKEIAPDVTRVAVLRDPTNSAAIAQFGVIQAMALPLRVEVSPIRCARRRRDRARRHGLRALCAWRSDRDIEWRVRTAPRSGHRAGGETQTAHRLLRALLRRCRWPNLLWA